MRASSVVKRQFTFASFALRSESGNYFVLFVGPGARRSRDDVQAGLKRRGIQSKRYFSPLVHDQSGQKEFPMRVVWHLPRTREASRTALALPLYSHIADDDQERVLREIESLLGS